MIPNGCRKNGASFVIENKAGGGNNIGVELVVKSGARRLHHAPRQPANGINATPLQEPALRFIRDIAPVAGWCGRRT